MIYFIQAGENGPIKIGFVKNAERIKTRLAGIQTGNHEQLSLIKMISGTENKEKEIHTAFRANHLRGEWFEPTPKLKEFISNGYSQKSNGQLLNAGRGGARPGAGRPKKYAGGRRRFRIVVPETSATYIEALEQRTLYRIIMEMLEQRYPDQPWRVLNVVAPEDEKEQP